MIGIRDYAPEDAAAMLALYTSVGWTNYTDRPDMLRRAYAHSLCALVAEEDGEIVGAVRAVGDGASALLIQDLLVRPERQRQGIVTRLMRALLARYPDVYQTQLLTDDTEKTVAFYRSLGFERVEEMRCCAMLMVK